MQHSFLKNDHKKGNGKKNNIWFSRYNFYICGKLEIPFFNFITKNKKI